MALQWRGALTGEDRTLGTVYRVLMQGGKFAALRTLPEGKDCGTFDTMDEARKACDEAAKSDKPFTPAEPQGSPPAAEKPSGGAQTPPPAQKPASPPPKPATGHHAPTKGKR